MSIKSTLLKKQNEKNQSVYSYQLLLNISLLNFSLNSMQMVRLIKYITYIRHSIFSNGLHNKKTDTNIRKDRSIV